MRNALLVLAASCLLASTAHAGETNPDVAACEGKADGDTCVHLVASKTADGPLTERRLPGVCRPDECCDLDYSKGSPPETKCGPCLACQAGPGTPSEPSTTTAADPEPVAAPPDAADDGGSPPAMASHEDKKGCTIGSGPRPGFAALVLLALGLRRRRG